MDAIRFYQRQRLLKPPARTEGGFRLFDRQDIQTLRFIRTAQELGFSLSEIRQLLYLQAGQTQVCSHVRDLLQQKLAAVRSKMDGLRKLERKLKAGLRKCNQELKASRQCPDAYCPVLEEIRRAAEN